jgi:hypothetical protein
MKKIVLGLCGLLSGLFLNGAVQAAPISYRFDPTMHVEMQHFADGSFGMIGLDGPLIPASAPLSFMFTYESEVVLTPRDLPPSSTEVIYVDIFDAAGAFTNMAGTVGDYRFSVVDLSSMTLSYINPNIYPGDTINRSVGAVGRVIGEGGSDLTGVWSSQSFKLTNVSVTFGAGPVSGVLPFSLTAFGGGSNVQLDFTGDDGTVVTAAYFGTLTEVPLPGALWLFGSSLLAPLALRARNKKQHSAYA